MQLESISHDQVRALKRCVGADAQQKLVKMVANIGTGRPSFIEASGSGGVQ